MGVSRTPAELARKFRAAAEATTQATTLGVTAATQLVTASVARELGGRTKRLRGLGKSGGNIGVRYDIAQAGTESVIGIVRMTGPAHLYERDTRPHPVGVRSLKRSGDVHSLMVTPQGVRTGPWIAGGSKGKHPFERGWRAAEPLIPRAFQRGLTVALRAAFR